MAARHRGVRQCRPHGAAARCAPPGSARRLHQRAQAPETQGVSLALDAADRRALDCVSGIHRRQRGSLRVPQTEDRWAVPTVRFLDVILARGDPAKRGAILSRTGCQCGQFRAGGARRRNRSSGCERCSGPVHGGSPRARRRRHEDRVRGSRRRARGRRPERRRGDEANWLHLGPLPQDELAELMRAARLVVANGGSTLLQAIACGSACIAVPIAKDQARAHPALRRRGCGIRRGLGLRAHHAGCGAAAAR